MTNEIINKAIIDLKAEQEATIQSEMAKVENDILLPKYAEIEKEKADLMNAAKIEYDQKIASIQSDANVKKSAYANSIRTKVAEKIEEDFHYAADIKVLENLINK